MFSTLWIESGCINSWFHERKLREVNKYCISDSVYIQHNNEQSDSCRKIGVQKVN